MGIFHQSQYGFSLVELTLVMATLAIVMGVWFGTADFTGNSLDRAVRRIESDLRYCQRLAMVQAVACGMDKIDPTHYNMYVGTISTLLLDPLTRQDAARDLAQFHPQLVFIGEPSYRIEFGSDGLAQWVPSNAAPIAIQLWLEGRTRQVMIAQQTGYISVPTGN